MTIEDATQSRLKRLYYRSCHRGNKESDIILSHFAQQTLPTLAVEQLDVYERFLDEEDSIIWDWLIGKSTPENQEYLPLISILKGYGLPGE